MVKAYCNVQPHQNMLQDEYHHWVLRQGMTGSDTPQLLSTTTGVPQGSILDPLLFIIYMNDIYNASTKFHAILFADDTNLSSTLCSFDVNIDNNCNRM